MTSLITHSNILSCSSGFYTPRRINVNIFIPSHPPAISGPDPSADFDEDSEHAVPGLSSISMSAGTGAPEPCIALGFFAHSSGSDPAAGGGSGAVGLGMGSRPRQAALVLRHDRTRRRGVRVDVSVTTPSQEDDELFGSGEPSSERPPQQIIEELEEAARRGGYFGVVGKVWAWISKTAK